MTNDDGDWLEILPEARSRPEVTITIEKRMTLKGKLSPATSTLRFCGPAHDKIRNFGGVRVHIGTGKQAGKMRITAAKVGSLRLRLRQSSSFITLRHVKQFPDEAKKAIACTWKMLQNDTIIVDLPQDWSQTPPEGPAVRIPPEAPALVSGPAPRPGAIPKVDPPARPPPQLKRKPAALPPMDAEEKAFHDGLDEAARLPFRRRTRTQRRAMMDKAKAQDTKPPGEAMNAREQAYYDTMLGAKSRELFLEMGRLERQFLMDEFDRQNRKPADEPGHVDSKVDSQGIRLRTGLRPDEEVGPRTRTPIEIHRGVPVADSSLPPPGMSALDKRLAAQKLAEEAAHAKSSIRIGAIRSVAPIAQGLAVEEEDGGGEEAA